MATLFQSQTIAFDKPGSESVFFDFGKDAHVTGGTVVLQGFYGSYGSNKDHNLRTIDVQITDILFDENWIKCLVSFRVDDKSGNKMPGNVTVAAIVDA